MVARSSIPLRVSAKKYGKQLQAVDGEGAFGQRFSGDEAIEGQL